MAARTVCRKCLQLGLDSGPPVTKATAAARRLYSSSRPPQDDDQTSPIGQSPTVGSKEKGPMARRLEAATEEALLTGGRSGRRAVEEAGFSESLKEELLKKISIESSFPSGSHDSIPASGITSIPASAGRGTVLHATSRPWTGTESTEDAVLRMLDDATPKLRGSQHAPSFSSTQTPMNPVVQMPTSNAGRRMSAGQRVDRAREKAAAYADVGKGLTPKEREEMAAEMRERFRPTGRIGVSAISGIAALANERIEDAIARGQFKNIPRGPGIKRDTRVDNPFVDTTEYIMNNMIKRQDCVPPWIEKQQELLRAASSFRTRLRADWKRHAARMIASQGGTLEEQVRRAEAYARAEAVHNPRRKNIESGSVPVTIVTPSSTSSPSSSSYPSPPPSSTPSTASDSSNPLPRPYRDPTWETTEQAYMNLSIERINALARSYNLMAPDLAKKPYFSLQRELDACYADVAPEIAGVIRERATALPASPSRPRSTPVGLGLGELFVSKGEARIYEDRRVKYGFKEMWRDFRKKS